MTEDQQVELVKLAQKGNMAAFEKLVKLHQNKVYPYALTIAGGDHATASDILQEAFIKAYLNIKKFNGNSSFISWLWKIMKNEFINYIKSAKTRSSVSLEVIPESKKGNESHHEEDMIESERKKNLMILISKLPAKYGEAVVMIDIQLMNYEEASSILGISVGALKSRVFRGREELAKLAKKNLKLFM